jgi:hypothetical protein
MHDHKKSLSLTALVCLVSGLAAQPNASAADVATTEAGMSTLPIASLASPVHSSTIVQYPRNNTNFTPICLPACARVHGLSLSGRSVMRKLDCGGSGALLDRKISWKSRFRLESGCALLTVEQPTLIECGPGLTYVEKSTTIVAHTDGTATRFVNLSDHHRESVRVTFANHFVELDPGVEVVFVKSASTDAQALAVQEDIGWKDLKHDYVDGLHIFVFRVSAADMLKKCKIYRQLNQSTLAFDHELRDELVKTVAALEQMYNKKKGPFNLDAPYKYGPDGTQEAAKDEHPV